MQRRVLVGIVSTVFVISLSIALTLAFTLPKKNNDGEDPSPPNLIKVTPLNFIRAETNYIMRSMQALGILTGNGGVNVITHFRSFPDSPDFPIIRPNRDTLYSIVLTDSHIGPLQITLPPVDRYMSIECTNEDHIVEYYAIAPAVFHIQKETVTSRYIFCIIRTAVLNHDFDKTAIIQDRITIKAEKDYEMKPLEMPLYDQKSLSEVRYELRMLFNHMPDSRKMFGSVQDIDDIPHLIGVAGGWGGLSEQYALYTNSVVLKNDGETEYAVTVKDVPVNAFWSITVYDIEGFLLSDVDSSNINSYGAEPNDDGSYTINFSNNPTKINNINIGIDWNYTIRLYQPDQTIIDGEWIFPNATEVTTDMR